MDVDKMAAALLNRAVDRGQVAMRTDSSTPIRELRVAVRRIARDRGVRVRTGVLEDVLVVACTDADLWRQSTAVMRDKLTAPEQPNSLPG